MINEESIDRLKNLVSKLIEILKQEEEPSLEELEEIRSRINLINQEWNAMKK